MKKSTYTPVACELVDHIEIIATRKQKVFLKYNSECETASIELRTIVKSWTTRDKVEYIILPNNHQIRMDRIVIIDQFISGQSSCSF